MAAGYKVDIKDLNEKLTIEQKFAKALWVLRQVRPFYAAVFEVMEKHERKGLGTIGVTTNELFYDPEFVDKTPFEEFTYIIFHEVIHVGLMHCARKENRDNKLWNIAADLYDNKILCEELGISGPGQSVTILKYEIKAPVGMLYCSTLDTDLDYVEAIYAELEEQAKKNGYDKQSLSSKQDDGKFEFEYTGSKGKDSDGRYIPMHDGHETFRTTIDTASDDGDLIDNGSDQSAKNQESSKIMSDVAVRVDMNSTEFGSEPGKLEVLARKLLKSELDWKKLLRKYLIQATSKDTSFGRPDKRMYYQRAIYPGQTSDDQGQVKGVKVCIDTSGSVSDNDLAHFCGQVYGLTKTYKIDAELIYWDASVESTGGFKGYKEFERVSCYGRGGTNPAVIFEYFESKKCKVKPIVTLIFTDGYFDLNWVTPAIQKKYKDTIWIMNKHYNKDFTPPFGKKAIAKFE